MTHWLFTPDEASDPNATVETLRGHAPCYPEEVLGNPLLGLLALSDPEAWGEIQNVCRETIARRRIRGAFARAGESALQRAEWCLLYRLRAVNEFEATLLSLRTHGEPSDDLAHRLVNCAAWVVHRLGEVSPKSPDPLWLGKTWEQLASELAP